MTGEVCKQSTICKFPGKKVLLVEDKRINLEIVKGILEETEVEVLEAHNGAEAVAIMETSPEGHIDMIMMDIRMPVMKGDEATDAIRRLERKDCRRVPIIALSSKCAAEDEEKAYEYGMNGWLGKPVNPSEIYACLEDWFVS